MQIRAAALAPIVRFLSCWPLIAPLLFNTAVLFMMPPFCPSTILLLAPVVIVEHHASRKEQRIDRRTVVPPSVWLPVVPIGETLLSRRTLVVRPLAMTPAAGTSV